MKCGVCPVATTNPKDKMDCYFCPFDKVDAFHSLHDCSHLSELVERMAELLKEQQHEIWELQELNEHLTDQQKKIRMLVDSNGKIHPLEPEPVEPEKKDTFWICGKCGEAMTVTKGFVSYCWNCGTPVKWTRT